MFDKKASFTVDLWHKVQIDNAKNRCNSVLHGTLFAKNILFVKSNIHGVSFRNGMNEAIKNVRNLKWVSFVCTSRSSALVNMHKSLHFSNSLCERIDKGIQILTKKWISSKRWTLYCHSIRLVWSFCPHFICRKRFANNRMSYFLSNTLKETRPFAEHCHVYQCSYFRCFQFFPLHSMRFGVGSLSHFMKSLFKVYV